MAPKKTQKAFNATPDLSPAEREAKRAADLQRIGQTAMQVIAEMVARYNYACEACADDPDREIREDALSVEVRSDWTTPGVDNHHATEYRILLSTGGPATRIIGELDQYGEPTTARLEARDWFTPWTEYRDADESVLLTYARCFYFGDE